MTTALIHPPAEDLGRFIEGTLDDASRTAVVAHIADCDDCRIVVVDATEFSEAPAAKRGAGGRWWMTAAAAIAMLIGGAFIMNAQRNPLAAVIDDSSHLPGRLVEARLDGFSYLERHTTRGEQGDTPPQTYKLEEDLANVLSRKGDDAKTLHAKGVANLLTASLRTFDEQNKTEALEARKQSLDNAVVALQAAASRQPDNASYQSDLAAALIAKGDLDGAVKVCEHALQIEPRSAEALFNRAKTLDLLDRTRDAKSAYENYLKVDSTSPWAGEAQDRITSLNLTLSLP